MKKTIILFLILACAMPGYGSCWKYHSLVWTWGGSGPDGWGGSIAHSDKYAYFVEKRLYRDTIKNIDYGGAVCWQTIDGGQSFKPLVGYMKDSDFTVDTLPVSTDTAIYSATYLNSNYRVEMPDSNNVYFLGQLNSVLKTNDNGKTWKMQRFMTKYTYEWREFYDFKMYKNGFGAISYYLMNRNRPDEYTVQDSLLITTEDWTSSYWSRVNYETDKVALKWLSIPDTNTIYVCGTKVKNEKYYLLYKTTDKGKSWNKVIIPNNYMKINTICFVDSLMGWLGGYEIEEDNLAYNSIYKTTDGGKTWTRQLLDNRRNAGIMKMGFSDSQYGFALGNSIFDTSQDVTSLIVYHTSNGGENWIFDKPDTTGYLGSAIDLAVGSPTNTYLFIGWAMFKYYEDCEAGVEEGKMPPAPEQLNMYPNPVSKGGKGTINVGNTFSEPLENVYLYDINGNQLNDKIHYTINTNGEFEFNLSSELSSGTYMLVLQYGANRIKYCKVVVE